MVKKRKSPAFKKSKTVFPGGRSQASLDLCLRCGRHTQSLFEGPDGTSTLCTDCSSLYRSMRMTIYETFAGSFSVHAQPGARPVEVVGFNLQNGAACYHEPIVRGIPQEPSLPSLFRKSVDPDEVISISSESSGSEESDSDDSESDDSDSDDSDSSTRSSSSDDDAPIVSSSICIDERTPATAGNTPARRRMSASGAPRWKAAATPSLWQQHTEAYPRVKSKAPDNDNVPVPLPKMEVKFESSSEPTHSGVCTGRIKKLRKKESKEAKRKWIVHIKAECMPRTGAHPLRRFTLEYRTPFKTLKRQLREMFRIQSEFSVKYKDNDGDDVALSTSNELEEMFMVSRRHSIFPVRMVVKPRKT